MTVKSWINAAVLVLFLLAIYDLINNPNAYRAMLKDKRIVWLSIALSSAFVAILAGQILRFDIRPPAYDGPLRPLAGILILLLLTVRRVDFIRIFQWTCPLSVLICAPALWLNPLPLEDWGNRWGTYFVDPLTFGQYCLLLGFLSLFMINATQKDGPAAIALKLSAFVVGLGMSIGSGSRSAWVALPVLFAIWLVAIVRLRDIRLLLASFATFAVGCLLAYFLIDSVHLRVDAAVNDIKSYCDGGNRDTSVGLRLSLWQAAWHLFLTQPLQGFGDSGIPPLQSVPAIASYYTPALEYAIVHNGAHNELMQNMIRSGIFGLISTVLMFVVPLVVFASAARSRVPGARIAGIVGLAYISAVICFGLNTENFNLKYLASFYALMVAALAAQTIWADPRSPSS